jgi:hypothetical protein
MLGSPFTAAICRLIANTGLPEGRVYDRISTWPGPLDGAGGDAVALRLLGALHSFVLSGRDAALSAIYPPNIAPPSDIAAALHAAIERHGDSIDRLLENPPQTNETGRSAVLLPGFLLLQQRFQLPMVLSEMGSSAGLNQNWHRYAYDFGSWRWGDPASPVAITCDWQGEPPPSLMPIEISRTAGCDIAPISLSGDEDHVRLMSYIWPDQPMRLERLRGALEIASDCPPVVQKAAAANWLEKRLSRRHDGHLHAVFHTIMWHYMPDPEQARIRAIMAKLGRHATEGAPLAWLRLEADGESGSAGLYLTTWSGAPDDGETKLLARGDFHGRWINWLRNSPL